MFASLGETTPTHRRFAQAAAVCTFIGCAVLAAILLRPSNTELSQMFLQQSRFEQAIEVLQSQPGERMSVGAIGQLARVHEAAGDTASVINLYEELDSRGELEAIGLENLAHFYGKNQQPEKRLRTYLRLAEDHLNAPDSKNLVADLQASDMLDEERWLLKVMINRDFATMQHKLRLARILRHERALPEALGIYESMTDEEVATMSAADVRAYVRILETSGKSEMIDTTLARWISPEIEVEQRNFQVSRLFDTGEYELVFLLTRNSRLQDERSADLYHAALYVLRNRTPQYTEAYMDLLISQLTEADKPEVVRQSLFDLFSLGSPDAVFERVSRAGHADPLIEEIYLSSLETSGRHADLANYLVNAAEASERLPTDRLRLAGRLVSIDELALAEQSIRRLVIDQRARGEEATALEYIWHRRGRSPDIDWIGRHMLESGPDDYQNWEALLDRSAQATVQLDWFETTEEQPQMPARVLDTRIRLALRENNAARVESLFGEALKVESLPPTSLNGFFEIACNNGYPAARNLFMRIDASAELSANAHLCAARIAAETSQAKSALEHFSRAERLGAEFDFDDRVRRARAMLKTGGPAAARALFQAAVVELPPIASASVEQNKKRGYLLVEAGENSAAAESFDAVLSVIGHGTGHLRIRKLLMEIYLSLKDYQSVLRVACRDDCQ